MFRKRVAKIEAISMDKSPLAGGAQQAPFADRGHLREPDGQECHGPAHP